MRIANLSTAEIIASLAAIISVIALAVLIRSCSISQHTFEVSVLEYNNSRALILKGVVQESQTSIQISPLDPAFLLQEVHYQFPSEFGTGRKYAIAPTYILHLSDEIANFKKLLKKRYRDQAQGRTIGENARMPFLIETYSSVKGESFRSKYLYTLNFKFEVLGNSNQELAITLTGITFGSQIARGDDPTAALEIEWKEAQKN